MRYGLDLSIAGTYADPRSLAELAREAEQAGWDGLFVWDVLFGPEPADAPVTDPWVVLAAVAMATRRTARAPAQRHRVCCAALRPARRRRAGPDCIGQASWPTRGLGQAVRA